MTTDGPNQVGTSSPPKLESPDEARVDLVPEAPVEAEARPRRVPLTTLWVAVGVLVIVGVAVAVGWYARQVYVRTPTYSLKQLSVALQQGDKETAAHYFNTPAVATSVSDAAVQQAGAGGTSPLGVVLGAVADVSRPAMEKYFADRIDQYLWTPSADTEAGQAWSALRIGEYVVQSKDGVVRVFVPDAVQAKIVFVMVPTGDHWQIMSIENPRAVLEGLTPDSVNLLQQYLKSSTGQ